MKKPKTVAAIRKVANKRKPAKKAWTVGPFDEAVAVGEKLKTDEYQYVQLRLPKPVFNILKRAGEIAGMEQAEISLALVAVALARAEVIAKDQVLL